MTSHEHPAVGDPSAPIRVLYVDDSDFDRALVRDALTNAERAFTLSEAATQAEFESYLGGHDFDLVLSDFNILGFEGLDVLEAVREHAPGTPVVIVTGTGSEEIAVEALRLGAAEYVIKTTRHIRRLPRTICGVLEKARLQAAEREAQEALQRAHDQNQRIIAANVDGMLVMPETARYCSPIRSSRRCSAATRERCWGARSSFPSCLATPRRSTWSAGTGPHGVSSCEPRMSPGRDSRRRS